MREILPLHWVRGCSLVDFYGSNHSDVSVRCLTDTGESACQAAHVKSILGHIHDPIEDQSGSDDSEKHKLLHTPGLHKAPLSVVRYLPAVLLTEIFLYTLDGHFDILRVLTARKSAAAGEQFPWLAQNCGSISCSHGRISTLASPVRPICLTRSVDPVSAASAFCHLYSGES